MLLLTPGIALSVRVEAITAFSHEAGCRVSVDTGMACLAEFSCSCECLLPMKGKPITHSLCVAAAVVVGLSSGGATAVSLTKDPLTGLPLAPTTDSRLHLGNEPTRIPEIKICGSKMASEQYPIFDEKFDATLAWYDTHLPGFKHIHGAAENRSRDAFYSADGKTVVFVTSEPSAPGASVKTHGVLYASFQPALTEPVIVSINAEKVVCR